VDEAKAVGEQLENSAYAILAPGGKAFPMMQLDTNLSDWGFRLKQSIQNTEFSPFNVEFEKIDVTPAPLHHKRDDPPSGDAELRGIIPRQGPIRALDGVQRFSQGNFAITIGKGERKKGNSFGKMPRIRPGFMSRRRRVHQINGARKLFPQRQLK
jgi:hypothetical protein